MNHFCNPPPLHTYTRTHTRTHTHTNPPWRIEKTISETSPTVKGHQSLKFTLHIIYMLLNKPCTLAPSVPAASHFFHTVIRLFKLWGTVPLTPLPPPAPSPLQMRPGRDSEERGANTLRTGRLIELYSFRTTTAASIRFWFPLRGCEHHMGYMVLPQTGGMSLMPVYTVVCVCVYVCVFVCALSAP